MKTLFVIACASIGLCAPLLAQDLTDAAPPRAPAVVAPPPSVAQPDPVAIEAALARYAEEPDVQRVVQAALDAAPQGNTQALAARARMAGWVPRVGLRARRGQGVDLATSASDQSLRLSSNAALTLEASLVFELDRVVFRREEVALSRIARADENRQEARVRDTIHLYFERRRLQLERDLQGDPTFERSVRIAEIEALLDVFTNGAFRRMIAPSTWKAAGSTPASASPSPPKSNPTATP